MTSHVRCHRCQNLIGFQKNVVEHSFVLISNIPASLHTSDLRKFFCDFVETEKFKCFHFRHRPEKGRISESTNNQIQKCSTSFSKQVTHVYHE